MKYILCICFFFFFSFLFHDWHLENLLDVGTASDRATMETSSKSSSIRGRNIEQDFFNIVLRETIGRSQMERAQYVSVMDWSIGMREHVKVFALQVLKKRSNIWE